MTNRTARVPGFGSFGYAIDYDREIARDEALIAACDRALALSLYLPADAATRGESWTLVDLLVVDEAARDRLGLTAQDVADLLAFSSDDGAAATSARYGLPVGEYHRGRVVASRVTAIVGDDWQLTTEAHLRELRRVAVASRSRHIRNRDRA